MDDLGTETARIPESGDILQLNATIFWNAGTRVLHPVMTYRFVP